MHSKNDNIEVMIYDNVNEIIEIFDSLFFRYQIGIGTPMKGSDFIFDGVTLLYRNYHKIHFKLGASYIESPDWIKRKKKHQKNNDDKCFQYAATVP